jgi:ABC-type thiamine transport system substrate-binding protein
LAASDVSIVIQDPRSSTPGLGLVMWVQAAYGDRAGEIWAALADNIVTVTPGGRRPMVCSSMGRRTWCFLIQHRPPIT